MSFADEVECEEFVDLETIDLGGMLPVEIPSVFEGTNLRIAQAVFLAASRPFSFFKFDECCDPGLLCEGGLLGQETVEAQGLGTLAQFVGLSDKRWIWDGFRQAVVLQSVRQVDSERRPILSEAESTFSRRPKWQGRYA